MLFSPSFGGISHRGLGKSDVSLLYPSNLVVLFTVHDPCSPPTSCTVCNLGPMYIDRLNFTPNLHMASQHLPYLLQVFGFGWLICIFVMVLIGLWDSQVFVSAHPWYPAEGERQIFCLLVSPPFIPNHLLCRSMSLSVLLRWTSKSTSHSLLLYSLMSSMDVVDGFSTSESISEAVSDQLAYGIEAYIKQCITLLYSTLEGELCDCLRVGLTCCLPQSHQLPDECYNYAVSLL